MNFIWSICKSVVPRYENSENHYQFVYSPYHSNAYNVQASDQVQASPINSLTNENLPPVEEGIRSHRDPGYQQISPDIDKKSLKTASVSNGLQEPKESLGIKNFGRKMDLGPDINQSPDDRDVDREIQKTALKQRCDRPLDELILMALLHFRKPSTQYEVLSYLAEEKTFDAVRYGYLVNKCLDRGVKQGTLTVQHSMLYGAKYYIKRFLSVSNRTGNEEKGIKTAKKKKVEKVEGRGGAKPVKRKRTSKKVVDEDEKAPPAKKTKKLGEVKKRGQKKYI